MIPDWRAPIKRERIKKSILTGVRECGYKLTPQRRTVVEIITRDLSHPSARAIFCAAREIHPTISLSTVYSTLAMLKSLRLVKELEFEAMDNRYDMDTENHLNLICIRCGRVVDFDFTPPPKRKVEAGTGFSISDGRFEYYGICPRCRRSMSNEQ